MQTWRAGLVACGLVAGCGASLPDGSLEQRAPASEAVFASEQVGAPDEAAGPSPQQCFPTVGEAYRVKRILPPPREVRPHPPIPESLAEFRGQLSFAITFEDGHMALWRSAGTEADTVEVKSFPAMPAGTLAQLGELTPAGDSLFFVATEAATGKELWVTDGTTDGTRLVADLTPGPRNSELSRLAALGSTLVFFRGGELWRSDGSAAGTQQLLDLRPTFVSWNNVRLGSSLLFFIQSPSRGTELWKTDGTADGTARLRQLDAEHEHVAVASVRTDGSRAFFTLSDPNMTELWQTDGTPDGTRRMYTFGPDFFLPQFLSPLGEYLYFTVTERQSQRMSLYRMRVDGSGSREYVMTLPNPHGAEREALPYLGDVSVSEGKIFFAMAIGSAGPAPRDTQLWVTDGTRAGTQLLRRPLSLSDEYGSPVFAVSGGLAFFSAYDPASGTEPWVTDGTVAGTRLLRNIAPGPPASAGSLPRSFTRVGERVFFAAYDETEAGQLWAVPLRRTCPPGAQ